MDIKEKITIKVSYNFDEEYGYSLDTDDLESQFRKQVEDLETDFSEMNHEREQHLKTKHGEC
jgi:hypothetical protein|tara:strand:+ start:295 stop:480 length:186 start_codon:yes stop_codon:yes gene_type:complete